MVGQNRWNMTSLWRHSRLTYYDLGPNFLTQGVELFPGEVWQVSKRNSQYFRSYSRKTTRGLCPPPPSGARVNKEDIQCWMHKNVQSTVRYSTLFTDSYAGAHWNRLIISDHRNCILTSSALDLPPKLTRCVFANRLHKKKYPRIHWLVFLTKSRHSISPRK